MGSRAKEAEAPRWKSKVVGWDNVDPAQLLANPANWRRHPAAQREALRGSLNELNIITPIIVNRTTGHVLDGHARVEEYITAGIKEVPVAYVEVPAEKEALDALLRDATTGEIGLQQMLADLATEWDLNSDVVDGSDKERVPGYIIQYGLVFDNEEQQDTWFAFLRLLNLRYPHSETIAARLTDYLNEHVLNEQV